MEATPVSEKRQLRARKPPPEPDPEPFDSVEEIKHQSKRRKTGASSSKKGKKPESESISKVTDDEVADPQSKKGTKAKARSSKGKAEDAPSCKAKAKSGKVGEKKKKKTRTVIKGDTGGLNMGDDEDPFEDEEEEEQAEDKPAVDRNKRVMRKGGKSQGREDEQDAELSGDPIDDAAAKKKWPYRYLRKGTGSISVGQLRSETPEDIRAIRHYTYAKVDGNMFELYDDAHVKAEGNQPDYICRIVEIFEGVDRKPYFTAQWFFRAEDTVIKQFGEDQDKRRLFLSEDKNDNPLDCIGCKLRIVRVEPNLDLALREKTIQNCDYYYDMSYSVGYSTFEKLSAEIDMFKEASTSIVSSESVSDKEKVDLQQLCLEKKSLHLLDLYSGCGGMSTGLCLGAALSGINLETTWAVDLNHYACDSLQRNHPKTHVRNEKAENFLALLKEWEKLVEEYNVQNEHVVDTSGDLEDSDSDDDDGSKLPKDVFEVAKLLNICYGDPHDIGIVGIKFLVRWKGYSSKYDTWEPIEGLSEAKERIREFVVNGYRGNFLPFPGTVDVLCGGPPCQGISGFNRYRNKEDPFGDEKNHQIVVFMDIVKYLNPRFVLMENVVDLLKFSNGFLGRYALGRLVDMHYQARLGIMVAGCYGLPQFRARVILCGALPTEVLPQFPLPTHNVVGRGAIPNEFEHHVVALDENTDRSGLKFELFLGDAISDLPAVSNSEKREEMPYGAGPENEFQQYIRLSRKELLDHSFGDKDQKPMLLDHQPLELNDDDYARTCRIPKRKGANFRDLGGLLVGPDNKCLLDESIERSLLPSGKPLVPDYAISHLKGKSVKCFGRLWWDETVSTVVTRAEPHNQIILHPTQDRVLTIRENARLQGFPDYYKFSGPQKQRYMQVGNAVAVPVARALGCALARAIQRITSDGLLFALPSNFFIVGQVSLSNGLGEVEQ